MTKWEVKEYITKIYDVPVKKVNGSVLQSVACLVQPAVAWTHLEILFCGVFVILLLLFKLTLLSQSEARAIAVAAKAQTIEVCVSVVREPALDLCSSALLTFVVLSVSFPRFNTLR